MKLNRMTREHVSKSAPSADLLEQPFFEWNRRARLSMDNNAQFVQEYQSGFKVFRQRTVAAEEALQALLPDPDQVFAHAEIYKPGSRTHAGMVTLAGRRYFLKRYNCRGWCYRLQNAFRRSRAVRTWLATWGFVVRGVPVPEPLLCLEERDLRLLGRSYILMEFAAGKEQLVDILPKLDDSVRLDLLGHLGTLLGGMHHSGCLHGDLKWTNILVGRQKENGWDVELVDLDGSRILSASKPARMLRDLRRFGKDLAIHATPEEQECFYRNWRKGM